MEVKPRELQMRQLTNVQTKRELISPWDERRFAAFMRDISDDTRTTPFNATIVDNTTLKSTDFLCFLLGSVTRDSVAGKDSYYFPYVPPPKKIFFMCVRIKE